MTDDGPSGSSQRCCTGLRSELRAGQSSSSKLGKLFLYEPLSLASHENDTCRCVYVLISDWIVFSLVVTILAHNKVIHFLNNVFHTSYLSPGSLLN